MSLTPDFTNIRLIPVIFAALGGVAIHTLWGKIFHKKTQKIAILEIGIQFISLFILSCGIYLISNEHSLTFCLQRNFWICLLFILPFIIIKTLDEKNSFSGLIVHILYTILQFFTLTSIIFAVIKLSQ